MPLILNVTLYITLQGFSINTFRISYRNWTLNMRCTHTTKKGEQMSTMTSGCNTLKKNFDGLFFSSLSLLSSDRSTQKAVRVLQ